MLLAFLVANRTTLKNFWPVTRVLLSQVKLCQTEWLLCFLPQNKTLLVAYFLCSNLTLSNLGNCTFIKDSWPETHGLIKIQPGIKRVITTLLTQGELYDIVLQSNDSYYHENRA